MKDTAEYVHDALEAAEAADSCSHAILLFLQHLNDHYCGDMYLEQSVGYLLSTVHGDLYAT